jgi:hypothetical protein
MAWLTREFRGKDKQEIEYQFARWRFETEGLVLNVIRHPIESPPSAAQSGKPLLLKVEYEIKRPF